MDELHCELRAEVNYTTRYKAEAEGKSDFTLDHSVDVIVVFALDDQKLTISVYTPSITKSRQAAQVDYTLLPPRAELEAIASEQAKAIIQSMYRQPSLTFQPISWS